MAKKEEKLKTAEELAEEMRAVSVAEFFEKNRHLLGYENPTKSMITIAKEFVDNSLDATNEAGILPEIKVVVKQLSEERFRISVIDNGPGIIEEKLSLAFGKLLYGSKFHRLRQSRGTQGLGATGAILYSQLTTGKPAKITSSIGKDIHTIELLIEVTKNEPIIVSHKEEKNPEKWHGVEIEVEAEGRYVEGKQSVLEYLRQTAIANPYATISYNGPNGKTVFKRVVSELPRQPKEIKPHPYGIEIGMLRRMLRSSNARNIMGFLTNDFSRVGKNSAEEMCKVARIDKKTRPQSLGHEDTERLHKAMQGVKLMSPPTDCLSPLGEKLIEEGLKKQTEAEHAVAISRAPSVYRGNPFQIEVGIAYGGKLPQDQSAQLFRLANKVPLLYHQSDCVTAEATTEVDWKRYAMSQSSSQLPSGPVAILIHFASVWVPYTSEGKQAIASYPDIIKEIKLALQDAGRKLAIYIRQKNRFKERQLRKSLFEAYMPEVANALAKLTDGNPEKIKKELEGMLKKSDIIKQIQSSEPQEEKRKGEKNERH